MEIFVRNIPTNQRSRRVNRAIKRAIHEALREEVPFEWSRFRNNRALATLTLPTWELGQRFLNHYLTGLQTLGGTICFGVSRKTPSERLVESLLAKMGAMARLPDERYQPYTISMDEHLNQKPDLDMLLR